MTVGEVGAIKLLTPAASNRKIYPDRAPATAKRQHYKAETRLTLQKRRSPLLQYKTLDGLPQMSG